MNAEEKVTAPLPAADERATVPLPGGDASTVGPTDAPKTLGRFVVRGWLGSGAFGDVYRAHDPQLDREVALKVAKPGSLNTPERLARFLREAKAAANLRHPHIVPLYETGQDGERRFIASAFIQGKTLETVIEEAYGERRDVSPPVPGAHGGRRDVSPPVPSLSLQQLADLGRKLADALAYAHSQGVVHRDVKPANVLVDAAGEPHLLDFGLAARQEDGAERLTQDGQGMGTPAYMAPEQAAGNGIAASDQYSLGCALYELATGRTPFAGGSAQQMFLHRTQPVPSPRSIRKDIPKDLDTLLLKCLEKEPARRYPNCSELADDLRRFASGEPVKVRRAGPVERFTRWAKRNKRLAGMGALVLLTMALGTGFSLGFGLYANDRQRYAEGQTDEAKKEKKNAEDSAVKLTVALDDARRNLARTYLTPLGFKQGQQEGFEKAELAAYQALANSADDELRLMVFAEALADREQAYRTAAHAERFVQASVGAGLDRRAKAVAILSRVAPTDDPQVQFAAFRFAVELESPPPNVPALVAGCGSVRGDIWAAGVGRFAAVATPEELSRFADALTAALTPTADDRTAEKLTAALRQLAERLPDAHATAAGRAVVRRLAERPNPVFDEVSVELLVLVADRLSAADVEPAVAPLVALVTSDDHATAEWVGKVLTALAARLDSPRAAAALGRVFAALPKLQTPARWMAFQNAAGAMAERLLPAEADRVYEQWVIGWQADARQDPVRVACLANLAHALSVARGAELLDAAFAKFAAGGDNIRVLLAAARWTTGKEADALIARTQKVIDTGTAAAHAAGWRVIAAATATRPDEARRKLLVPAFDAVFGKLDKYPAGVGEVQVGPELVELDDLIGPTGRGDRLAAAVGALGPEPKFGPTAVDFAFALADRVDGVTAARALPPALDVFEKGGTVETRERLLLVAGRLAARTDSPAPAATRVVKLLSAEGEDALAVGLCDALYPLLPAVPADDLGPLLDRLVALLARNGQLMLSAAASRCLVRLEPRADAATADRVCGGLADASEALAAGGNRTDHLWGPLCAYGRRAKAGTRGRVLFALQQSSGLGLGGSDDAVAALAPLVEALGPEVRRELLAKVVDGWADGQPLGRGQAAVLTALAPDADEATAAGITHRLFRVIPLASDWDRMVQVYRLVAAVAPRLPPDRLPTVHAYAFDIFCRADGSAFPAVVSLPGVDALARLCERMPAEMRAEYRRRTAAGLLSIQATAQVGVNDLDAPLESALVALDAEADLLPLLGHAGCVGKLREVVLDRLAVVRARRDPATTAATAGVAAAFLPSPLGGLAVAGVRTLPPPHPGPRRLYATLELLRAD